MNDTPRRPSNYIGSAHGWSTDEDDLSKDQIIECLSRGDLRAFTYNLKPQFALDHHDLVQSYIRTAYCLDNLDTTIRVGKYSRAAHGVTAAILRSRAEREGMVLISASNPLGKRLTWPQNQIAHEQFVKDMKDKGLLLGQGKGIADSPDPDGTLFWEPFCAVGPIDQNAAIELARQYQQVAVVFTGTLEISKLIFSQITPERTMKTAF